MNPCTNANPFTPEAIDVAYVWLCKQRKNFPPDADVWHVRYHWNTIRCDLFKQLRKQTYQLSPLPRVTKSDGTTIHLWSSLDAIVLKILSTVLRETLGLSHRCTHIKGHGGLKATVHEIQYQLPCYKFVMRTDVKSFYESIDHTVLLRQLNQVVRDDFQWRLLYQFIKHSVDKGGVYHDSQTGISRGCPLSPIIGAYYLKKLDEMMTERRLFYVRYMDDILIMTKTRWQLRRAIRVLNETFNELKLEKAPNKTSIGIIERGFDFLGYRFSGRILTLARTTYERFMEHIRRLYEQKKTALERAVILDSYVTRWLRWAYSGLDELDVFVSFPSDYTEAGET